MSRTSAVRLLVKSVVRRLSALTARRVGRPVTSWDGVTRVLVVAPHPDDETFGCGALLARLRSGGVHVRLVFVTDGGAAPRPAGTGPDEFTALRRAEAAAAAGVLGVDAGSLTYWGLDDGGLAAVVPELTDRVGALLDRVDPHLVLTTSLSDRHPDHHAVAVAVRSAARLARRRPRVWEFPIWQRVPAVTVLRGALRPDRARVGAGSSRTLRRPMVVAAGDHLQRKVDAIATYRSQLPHFPPGFVEDFSGPHELFFEVDRTSS